MVSASRRAFGDAGIEPKTAGAILVPRGTWGRAEPASALAERLGIRPVRTVMAELGILQLSVIRRACELILDGTVDAALVVGGEARHRHRVAQRAGVESPVMRVPDREPDERMQPKDEFMTRAEIEHGLTIPARQYAVIESTLRAAAGRTPAEHAAHLGRLWGRFAEIASADADAWDRSAPSAEEIAEPGPSNRMIAAPYTKWLCSQMNVDMAGALVLMAAGAAEAAGISEDRWVFPLAFGESNLMVPMPMRRDVHRWPAFGIAADRTFSVAGCTIGDVGPIDLYSCFPAAVETQAVELGLSMDRDLTVTGGMTFGGGPLNNYVFHAVVATAQRLRAQHGAVGLTTAVSGLLTKPGLALWSSVPRDRPFSCVDVTDEAARATAQVEVDGAATGRGAVVGYTVLYEGSEPSEGVAVVQLGEVRTIAVTKDESTLASMLSEEWVGREVGVPTAAVLTAT